ncbi:hypothetical protein, partial [Klebsiella aerogenes]|uniref:hypothetical protein n=1 Tax=Klebsiella aerogenes TaxID=548 RepID=UPI0019548AEF
MSRRPIRRATNIWPSITAYRAISKETLVAKPGSGLPNLVKQYGYYFSGAPYTITRQNAAKPAMIVGPSGNQTDYTYA